MEHAARGEEEEVSVESELATTVKYIDLYLRQKTDLFLQHYVFEPFEFLAGQLMFLSVLLALFAAGTLIVVAGVVLLIATVLPLWAALLLTGAAILAAGGCFAYVLFSRRIVLATPRAGEMVERGEP